MKEEIEDYYKTVQQQILNIIINNFDVPLAIVVNCRQELPETDDKGKSLSDKSTSPTRM